VRHYRVKVPNSAWYSSEEVFHYSAMIGGAVSHDKITRFLAEKELNSPELWCLVKPLVRELEDERDILIIDDTIEEKPYTDESELICWHYDHSKGRNLKKA
jgi:hypothetical protein